MEAKGEALASVLLGPHQGQLKRKSPYLEREGVRSVWESAAGAMNACHPAFGKEISKRR